jgi:hypothetical protein
MAGNHSGLAPVVDQVIPFFSYPNEMCQIIYTINAIQHLHTRPRNIVKNRGHFPSDEAAKKLFFLASRNITNDWKMPPRTSKEAINQFAIFGDRFTAFVQQDHESTTTSYTTIRILPMDSKPLQNPLLQQACTYHNSLVLI